MEDSFETKIKVDPFDKPCNDLYSYRLIIRKNKTEIQFMQSTVSSWKLFLSARNVSRNGQYDEGLFKSCTVILIWCQPLPQFKELNC